MNWNPVAALKLMTSGTIRNIHISVKKLKAFCHCPFLRSQVFAGQLKGEERNRIHQGVHRGHNYDKNAQFFFVKAQVGFIFPCVFDGTASFGSKKLVGRTKRIAGLFIIKLPAA